MAVLVLTSSLLIKEKNNMTINELNELSTTLLIGLGMFVIGVYLVYVMFGAFNMSRKKRNRH